MDRKLSRVTYCLVIVSFLFILTGSAGAQSSRVRPLDSRSFLQTEYNQARFQILISNLALQKSSNQSVRNFAVQNIQHQNQLIADILAVRRQRRIPIRSAFTNEQMTTLQTLSSLQGEDFDRAFLSRLVLDDHTSLLASQNQALFGRDSSVRTLATNRILSLQQILGIAIDTQDVSNCSATGVVSPTPITSPTPTRTSTPFPNASPTPTAGFAATATPTLGFNAIPTATSSVQAPVASSGTAVNSNTAAGPFSSSNAR